MSFLQALLRGFAASQAARKEVVSEDGAMGSPVRRTRRSLAPVAAPDPTPEPGVNRVGDEEEWKVGLANPTMESIYRAIELRAPDEEVYLAFNRLPASVQMEVYQEHLSKLPPDQIDVVKQLVQQELKRPWLPLPGPQTLAYYSQAEIIGYGGAAGSGKGLRPDEKVLSPFGWVEIGSLKVGSKLCAVDGTVTEVIGVYPRGVQPFYRLTFHDGTSIECDADHIWRGWWTGRGRKIGNEYTKAAPSNWTTTEIADRFERYRTLSRNYRFAIPAIEKPACFNIPGCQRGWGYLQRDVDPYLLGLLLGDGYINDKKICITSADDEIVNWVLENYEDDVRVAYRDGALTKELAFCGDTLVFLKDRFQSHKLGLENKRSADKFIPYIYKYGSEDERWALLQGLMDTDGWVERDAQAGFCSVSEQLADDVADLARSLGAIVFKRTREPTYTYKGETLQGQRAYTLAIKMPSPERMFRLTRKREAAAGLSPQSMGRFLVSIKRIEPQESVCIAIRHPSALFITRDFIVTHNSALMVGMAGQEHQKAYIFRRESVQLTAIIDYAKEVYIRHGWRYVSAPVTRMDYKDKTITFHHCKEPDDWRKYAGHPRDFLGIDEATEFLKEQVFGLMGWVRTTDPNQKCRVLFATNPPRSAEGWWFFDMFRPWLDPNYANRAGPGEIRWAVRRAGEIEFVEPVFDNKGKPQEIVIDGEPYTPQSYTFVPGRLNDNPYLVKSGYKAQLQALPEPLRSQLLYGDFMASQEDGAWQVIPSAWVQAAMDRWEKGPPKGRPMTSIGVDIAQGGADATSLAARYGSWFAPLQVHKGVDTTDGPKVAALVIVAMRDNCQIVIDIGGGWGGSTFDHLKNQGFDVVGFNPSASAVGKSREGLEFRNTRAQAWWTLREALDPVYGAQIALPPDPDLKTELCMPNWKMTNGGILIESKENIRKRLGRSTDRADAIVMCWMYGDMREQDARNTRSVPTQKFATTSYERAKGRPSSRQAFANNSRRWR